MNRLTMMALALAGATGGTIAATGADAATTISTTGSADFACLGTSSGCGQNFGQTFVAPTGTDVLTSATFYAKLFGSASLNYAFRVFAWNGTSQTGPALYDSGTQVMTNTNYQALTFAPNALLAAGQQYVALLATAGLGNTTAQGASQQISYNNPYTGGVFGYQRTDGTGTWNTYTSGDAAFSFTFDTAAAAVPEPATWATMMLGLGAIGFAMRRRRPDAATATLRLA